MHHTETELATLSGEDLVNNFQRAVELDTKSSGNGKNPFNKDQLKNELLRRLKKPENYQRYQAQEAGDGHDEFS